MTSALEPSFLLELGAYAVAFAGIRLFKTRLSRGSKHNVAQQDQTVEEAKDVAQVSLIHVQSKLFSRHQCKKSATLARTATIWPTARLH